MAKENNGFTVVSTITDDKGNTWDIVDIAVYGHHALMKQKKTLPLAGEAIPYKNIDGMNYVLLEDVKSLLTTLKAK